jgi:hypothetical protein
MENLFDKIPILKALINLYMPCYLYFLDNPLPEPAYEFFRLVCTTVY